MFKQIVLLFMYVSVLCACNIAIEKKPRIIIDNDAGGDDAMAIFMSLLYEKYFNGPEVLGLTTVNGNTFEDNVYINNQRILKVAKRQDVPIYRGSKTSLVITPDAGAYFGEDGLGDTFEYLDDLVPANKQKAVLALIELSKTYVGNLTVITIGSLTNIALAIKLDPNFLERLAHLYVGAGHIHSEENPGAEFNAHMDVEAYRLVVEKATPNKVTFLPFSQVKSSLNLSRAWREDVLGAIPTEIMRAQNKFERISLLESDRWQALDPALVAVAVKPDLVEEYKYSKNDIILCGDKRGINTNNFVDEADANVRIIYSVKLEEYKRFILDVFSSDTSS